MDTRTRVQVAAAFCAMLLLTPAIAAALEPVTWQTDLPTALRIAQQSNRLVLLHFWSPQCGPCRALEANVFAQPGFAQTLSVHYVPVKVNVAEQPGLTQAYHITQYPTEVVVGHDGRELSRFRAPQNPASYLATAAQIARANPPVLKPFHSGPATAPSIAMAPPAPPTVAQPATANAGPAPSAAAPAQAPVGLDGYCPVRLCENHAWVKGNRQYGIHHQGRLYFFAGPAEQQKFWQNPDRYAPIAGGEDPVAAVDQGLRVPGKREFGMYLSNRVYLFATEENLQRFKQNVARYSGDTLQAARPTMRY